MSILNTLGALGATTLMIGASVALLAGIVYVVVTVAKWTWYQ